MAMPCIRGPLACGAISTQSGDSVSTTTATGNRGWAIALPIVLGILTGGCASNPAPEYGGRWRPVNRYADAPQEIPLHQGYAFHASPMDGTLKVMLERWARDSKMAVTYGHSSDFTLHSAVARIRTDDLQQAVSQLSTAYATQGVVVTTDGNRIIVRGSAPASASISPMGEPAAPAP